MSDNLPELRHDDRREVARTDTDSWTNVFGDVLELARGIAGTEFVPRGLRDNIAATTAAILYGREVGLPPMTALNSTHVIEGRPSIAAEAMRAMVLAAGHDIEVLESSGSICRMRARRRGTERWTPEVTWTIDMARAANLTNKSNWKNHPRRMLQARASSELCELYFPDVVLGFRSVEEMSDEADIDPDAAVAAEPTTKVARKSRAAKKTTAAPPPKAAERPVMDGPPLPGEPGYEPETPQAPVDQSSAGGETATADAVGEDVEPPAGDAQAQTVLGQVGEHPDVVDAELVDDGPPIEEPPPTEDEEPRAEVDTEPKPGPSTRAQHRLLFARLGHLDVEGDGERLAYTSALIGRDIDSFNHMTKAEATQLIETLSFVRDRESLDALVNAAEERRS